MLHFVAIGLKPQVLKINVKLTQLIIKSIKSATNIVSFCIGQEEKVFDERIDKGLTFYVTLLSHVFTFFVRFFIFIVYCIQRPEDQKR
jgi:hypothetical protein